MRFRKRFSKQKRERILFCSTEIEFVFLYHARPNFAKRNQRSKWKIPPQTPPFPFATPKFKNESAEVLANPFPKKLLCQNFVRISPATCPNTWRADTKKKKCSLLFGFARARFFLKKERTFFFLVFCRGSARRWRGVLRAYDLVSLHHALRA